MLKPRRLRTRVVVLIRASLIVLLVGMFSLSTAEPVAGQAPAHLGYGVNPSSSADPRIGQLGFDWTKTFGAPQQRLPYRVLARITADHTVLDRLSAWGDELERTARETAGNVEAWEIGNEPNLDADYGWGAPPNAADYVRVLREAYEHIKRGDPTAIVVSAGLATTGRIPFTWRGHRGYCAPGIEWCPVYYQDEREFLREMLREGAANALDALGYHPYGFSAPYDAAPGSGACGPNDFCFRSTEVLRQIMVDEFGIDKPIWATEFGWIVDPRQVERPECWRDPSMAGFQWMVVSPETQASNLRGAYQWAEDRYPWMGGLFLFNYGFYSAASCDQMGFFDIAGRPAEAALREMAKNVVPARPAVIGPAWLMADAAHPETRGTLSVYNLTLEPLRWQARILDTSFPLIVSSEGQEGDAIVLTADARGLPVGIYNATIQVTVTSAILAVPVKDPVQTLPVTLRVVEQLRFSHLPLVTRKS